MESDIITPETYTEYKAKLLADPNYQYFMTYQFQGMDNCKDTNFDLIEDLIRQGGY